MKNLTQKDGTAFDEMNKNKNKELRDALAMLHEYRDMLNRVIEEGYCELATRDEYPWYCSFTLFGLAYEANESLERALWLVEQINKGKTWYSADSLRSKGELMEARDRIPLLLKNAKKLAKKLEELAKADID